MMLHPVSPMPAEHTCSSAALFPDYVRLSRSANPTHVPFSGKIPEKWRKAARKKGFTIVDRVKDRLHVALLCHECGCIRCAQMLSDPTKKVMVMGNHGVLVVGASVADTFNRLYYFERAAETYIRALKTGQKLRVLSNEIAEKTAQELDDYPGQADAHLREIRVRLDAENNIYAQ
jgi:ribulose-5-phosphate 4-epimerase/fuculose-1-phosphate aldolase